MDILIIAKITEARVPFLGQKLVVVCSLDEFTSQETWMDAYLQSEGNEPPAPVADEIKIYRLIGSDYVHQETRTPA